MGHDHISCPPCVSKKGWQRYVFGKREKDKDVRISESQYKSLVGGMSKKERKDFDRRQRDLKRDREDDRLEAWLDFEDDMDDMGW